MLVLIALGVSPASDIPRDVVTLTTRHVVWTIASDGRNLSFKDRKTGRDWLDTSAGSVAFFVRVGAEVWLPQNVQRDRNRLEVQFHGGEVTARFAVRETADAVLMDVEDVRGPADELTFGQVMLNLRGEAAEPIAVCALARNVIANVPELPGASSILRATAYRRLGFRRASAAFVTAPFRGLRSALKRILADAPDLPHSPVGGPWALDSPPNRRSYLFNFGGLNVGSSKPWIDLAHALGAGQIDFHGGVSFRFGDFRPNPETYPNGVADLKATVDVLHGAGLQAGLHTYSFFLAKDSRYVSPVPDPRLASARVFTLAEAVDASSDTITVNESTEGVHATTGFFVNNSATLRIGTELVTFREASQTPPWRFIGCTRGALGTTATAHAAGEQAHHLKELFGLFAPDPESDLFLEVVDNTARMYNECGFDMIYLDALDGSYILEGPEWAWYHGARFVYELVRRLKKPPILEMSTFHHHLWCVRARMGAWDAPHTGYKEFVDMHRVVNRDCERMFLPSHLGWWGVFPWNGIQPDRTFPDDLEYLLCKALADDAGVSFVAGFSPQSFPGDPGAQRYAATIRRYEELRRTGAVPERIRRRLGIPGEEFTLVDGPRGKRAFVPVSYDRTLAEGPDAVFQLPEGYGKEPLELRVEPLLSTKNDATPAATLFTVGGINALSSPRCAEGVQLQVSTETGHGAHAEVAGAPTTYLRLTASSKRGERRGAWAMVERVFPAPVDMQRKGIVVWVHGDGSGAVLNFQLRNAENVSPGVAEHYVVVDFTGWRRFLLVEPESDRLSRYSWPYAGARTEWQRNPGLAFTSAYKTYHPWLSYQNVAALSVWINEIPAGGAASVGIGDITAVPLTSCTVRNPAITIGADTITFPCDLTSGEYIEMAADGRATVYGPKNEVLRAVQPQCKRATDPVESGTARFRCEPADEASPRVRLTFIRKGKPLRF